MKGKIIHNKSTENSGRLVLIDLGYRKQNSSLLGVEYFLHCYLELLLPECITSVGFQFLDVHVFANLQQTRNLNRNQEKPEI